MTTMTTIDNTPEWAKAREWRYQIQVNDKPAISGVFVSSEDLAEIKLSGMYKVGTWKSAAYKRSADGRLTGVRLIARSRGQNITAIAVIA